MVDFQEILQLPSKARLRQRLTKAFFLDKTPLQSSEKRFLTQLQVQMQITASIKQSTSNVPAFQDEEQAYNEVLIIHCELQEINFEKQAEQCFALIQKYIPHHLLLIAQSDTQLMLNACTKRINQADKSRRVIEQVYTSKPINSLYSSSLLDDFLEQLAFAKLDTTDLKHIYDSYIQAIVGLNTAQATNSNFRRSKRTEHDLRLLEKIEDLEQQNQVLKNQLKKESQLNRQVELNMQIRANNEEVEMIKTKLNEE